MNALMLRVIAARVEGSFPGEAEDLRRIATAYQKMAAKVAKLQDHAAEADIQAATEEEQIKQEDQVYMNRRKSRMIMQAWNRLEQRIKDGVILPDYDAGADLQRICTDWAANR